LLRQYHGRFVRDIDARLRFIFTLIVRNSCRYGNQFMSLATSIAIYFIIWWTVLFAVLPWGVRSQHESGAIAPGTDPGAPAVPRLKRKLIWTTIVASVVFALWHVVYTYRLITLDDLARWLGTVPPRGL
jgi:predicted secreted protein